MTRVIALLALAFWPAVACGAAFTLTEGQQQEAIRMGEESVTVETSTRNARQRRRRRERARHDALPSSAVAARHAAFSKKPLKPGEPAKC